MKPVKKELTIIGLTEDINFQDEQEKRTVKARIDTGATMSSIDKKLASELGFKKKVREIKVRNSHGKSVRDIVLVKFVIDGVEMEEEFSLADRSHMRFRVLIGQNVLKIGNFLINPNKN